MRLTVKDQMILNFASEERANVCLLHRSVFKQLNLKQTPQNGFQKDADWEKGKEA